MPEVTISPVDSEPVNFDVGGWLRSPAGCCLRSDKAETALLLFWFDEFSVKLSTMTIYLIWLIVYNTFNAKVMVIKTTFRGFIDFSFFSEVGTACLFRADSHQRGWMPKCCSSSRLSLQACLQSVHRATTSTNSLKAVRDRPINIALAKMYTSVNSFLAIFKN